MKLIYLFSKTPSDDVIHIPIIATKHVNTQINFRDYDAIVLTSKEAVVALEEIDGSWITLPVFCISSKTADLAKKMGAVVMDTATGYGDDVGEKILKKYSYFRWLYPRAEIVASDFASVLKEKNVNIDEKIVYKSDCNNSVNSVRVDEDAVLIFTSPLTVECFLKNHQFLPSHKVIAIGRTTKEAIPKEIEVLIPQSPSVENCVELAKRI